MWSKTLPAHNALPGQPGFFKEQGKRCQARVLTTDFRDFTDGKNGRGSEQVGSLAPDLAQRRQDATRALVQHAGDRRPAAIGRERAVLQGSARLLDSQGGFWDGPDDP